MLTCTQLFSALYGMLPEAKNYLTEGGFSPQASGYILIGGFLGGIFGIQIVSRFLHRFIPSHVVDCDHTHEGKDKDEGGAAASGLRDEDGDADEHSPLLSRENSTKRAPLSRSSTAETTLRSDAPSVAAISRRPSLQIRLTTRVSTLVSGGKATCDESGPCYGYSDPCGQECSKVFSRSPAQVRRQSSGNTNRQPTLLRSSTAPLARYTQPALDGVDEESQYPRNSDSQDRSASLPSARIRRSSNSLDMLDGHGIPNHHHDSNSRKRNVSTASTSAPPPNDPSQAHHHHVPTNAFMSIGLQTSIAIALHKLPEGFITFATNHVNPELGFAVFLALFIHNITEGFTMALPLYLALGSRVQAMLWSSLLGGISQPLGAGIAAIWFKVAGRSDMTPGESVYGVMFAVTAGIMTSVALQLFTESLGLTHNRTVCLLFAFVGMGILGLSFALTAS